MRHTIQLLLIATTFFCFNILKSQTTFQSPKLSPPTPEVFSLFKFTDIPVSNTTGIPNISIPVYTVKLKDFEFPIYLSYHSSGIRIEEIASNVGLGWTLNSGGMIYNQVNDLDDYEAGSGFVSTGNSIPQNRELDPALSGVEQQYNPTNPDYYKALELSSVDIDTQPDVYYYNCGNLNGKFFYSTDGVANPMPYSPIKILRKGYYSFVITDEKGIKYTFERISETTTATTNIDGPAYHLTYNETKSYTFHIAKIETLNNEIINFNYEDEKYSYDEPSVFTSRESTYKSSGQFGDFIPGGLPLFVETETKNTVILKGKRLVSISTNTGENIQFLYNNCARLDLPSTTTLANEVLEGGFALQEIKINSGQRTDSYVLEHGYFNVPNYTPCTPLSTYDPGRLKLISLKKNSEPPYQFKYDESAALPGRFDTSYDHWGYFKKSGGRYSIDYDLDFFDGVNRDPELDMTKLGVLNKIIYPTSGYTTFDYELNDYKGIFKTNAKRVERSVQVHIIGGEELGLPNEAQSLYEPFTIPQNYVENSAIIIKEISTGEQTTENFVNIYIKEPNNRYDTIIYKIVPESTTSTRLVYRMQNLLPGDYELHVDGAYSGGGATILWIEKEGEDSEESKNVKVGGLRVKSISNYDNVNLSQPATRQFYEYNKIENPLESSGIVVASPQYSYVETRSNPICVSAGNAIYLDEGFMTYRCRSSKNHLPLSGLQGYHIMYPEVSIHNADNLANGYTDYKYSIATDDKSYNIHRGTPTTSHDFKRADLLEQNTYKYNRINGKYLPVKKVENEYYYGFDETSSFFSSASNPNEKHSLGLIINKLSGDLGCATGSWGIPIPPHRSLFETSYFKLYSVWKYLKKSTDSSYDNNGVNPVTVVTNYNYSNPVHAELSAVTMLNSEEKKTETKYFYPQDPEMASEPFVKELIAANRVGSILNTQTFRSGNKLSEQKTVYDKSKATSNLLLPKYILENKGAAALNAVLDKKISYDLYDDKGNILQYTLEGAQPTSIIWGYDKTLPSVKIENSPYNIISSSWIYAVQNASSDDSMAAALNNLRSKFSYSAGNAKTTTYMYKPFIGVTRITDPTALVTYYDYDSSNRLKFVKDSNFNILEAYCYNYKGQVVDCEFNAKPLYKSVAMSKQKSTANLTLGETVTSNSVVFTYANTTASKLFTKNDCKNSKTIPETVNYTVEVGTYESTISQEDADEKANQDLKTNGQAYANSKGKCIAN